MTVLLEDGCEQEGQGYGLVLGESECPHHPVPWKQRQTTCRLGSSALVWLNKEAHIQQSLLVICLACKLIMVISS